MFGRNKAGIWVDILLLQTVRGECGCHEKGERSNEREEVKIKKRVADQLWAVNGRLNKKIDSKKLRAT